MSRRVSCVAFAMGLCALVGCRGVTVSQITGTRIENERVGRFDDVPKIITYVTPAQLENMTPEERDAMESVNMGVKIQLK